MGICKWQRLCKSGITFNRWRVQVFKKDGTRQKDKANKLKGHEVVFIFSTAPKRGVKGFHTWFIGCQYKSQSKPPIFGMNHILHTHFSGSVCLKWTFVLNISLVSLIQSYENWEAFRALGSLCFEGAPQRAGSAYRQWPQKPQQGAGQVRKGRLSTSFSTRLCGARIA